MALILRMIGPKYLDAIPILIVFMIANVNAIPQNIRPAELIHSFIHSFAYSSSTEVGTFIKGLNHTESELDKSSVESFEL